MKKVLFILFGLSLSTCLVHAQDIRLPEKPKTSTYVDYNQVDKGFCTSLELEGGSSVIIDRTNVQYVMLAYFAGYRFNEFLKVGAGIGSRYYVNNNSSLRSTDVKWAFPIYASVRGNIISEKSRTAVPYWGVNIGAAIRDGFYFSPTLGMRFGDKRNAFLLGVSYSLNELDVYPGDSKCKSFMSLKIGYEF